MGKINVLLADDHVLVRNGIKSMLESEADISVVGEASDGIEAVESVKKLKPDIVILDIRMPKMTGLEAAAKLRQAAPGVKSVILSMHDSEEYVIEALNAGAFGYLLKDTDKSEFIKALKQISTGAKYFSGAVSNVLANRLLNSRPAITPAAPQPDPYHLTRREREILRLVVDGKQNKEIAESMEKSVRTVETHRIHIMQKLGVRNFAELIKYSIAKGLV